MARNLAVSAAASLALLAAIAALALLMPRYVRARRVEGQLDIARGVQERLLPVETPAPSQLDIAARCIPTWGVGGDYYDLFEVDGKVEMVVADVSGKGLPAAIIAGAVHGAVRAAAGTERAGGLAGLARRVNAIVEARTDPNRFVSLFWGQCDLATCQLEYVNAGHLPPLLVRSGDDGEPTVDRLAEGGPVLGLLPDADYRAGQVALGPGDLLLLYSDGVTEAAAPSGEEVEEHLLRSLSSAYGQPAAGVVQRLLDDIHRFTNQNDFAADLTLVAVSVRRGQDGLDAV